MKLIKIALKSALNRKVSLSLAIFSIAISILLLLGVDILRKQAKNNFLNTISKTDLIVGARSGPTNLLLYSIFHIGNATNNVSYESYKDIISNKKVKWSVPISLGDSHKGFRVMGTNSDYFKYYKYADSQKLKFKDGVPFSGVYDAVVGNDVAESLGYKIGSEIILSHGMTATKYGEHRDKPFRIVGILEKTGTPVDRSVMVTLQGIEAIHIDWQSGTRSSFRISAEDALKMGLEPKNITAFMLGLNNKIDIFRLKRDINDYNKEPLLAIMPGATLAYLWQTIGGFEKVLIAISALVLLAGLIGLLIALLTTLNERRREMAVLRAVGAHAYHILMLFVLEAMLVVILGCSFGVGLVYILQIIIEPIVAEYYGIHLQIQFLDTMQMALLGIALVLAILLSLIPGFIAYKRSLQDGLMVKV